MSADPYQHGHRAQSARRYRQDGETFGDNPFGGYAGATAVSAQPGWGAPAAEWNAAPAQNPWGTPPPDAPDWDVWGASDSESDGHGDYDYRAADDTPYDPDRAGWPRTDPGLPATPADTVARPHRVPARRAGAHRMPAPPTALKGRAAVVAVAAGAVVAAGQATMQSTAQAPSSTTDYQADGQVHEIAAQSVSVADPSAGGSQSSQLVSVAPVTDISQFSDILQHGEQFAADLAAQEAAKLRPLYTRFAYGNFTSTFGFRWGAPHEGVDVAAPIGTPIYAVEDGTVIDAGPASGFGMWVRLRHDDGTVTVYGHVDTTTVSVGQRVMAGDQIATVGNRGFSTGPHCHFEVHPNGGSAIDPLPWLASRGISLGPERD
ncbi:M23 family metallopeptidase [Nocardia blacklockiae]|uniref:M23 family metallopeptidase n=1 Tax=Nocardia blacklockiae TaxID=480036 RepID=UPI0018951FB3|nr:M23 family metallopeptidase [Nocardia blacklockiae]MBF6172679.1 peptidoglycan DD-metalloendopeptidase family protein [Nocardia blacklockiae]